MADKFAIGDTVRINPNSFYRDQIEQTDDTSGTIYDYGYGWYDVKFENGYENSYKVEHLIPVKPLTNKEGVRLLQKED